MSVIRSSSMEYVESGIGTQLWDNGSNGGTSLVRLLSGAYLPNHNHPGWEQAYVLSGKVAVGADVIGKGDCIFAKAGDVHDAKAMEDTKF